MKRSKLIIIIILFVTIVTPVLASILKFSNNSTSGSPSSWSEFAAYFTAFLTLGNLLLFGFFTFEIHRYNSQRDDEAKRINDVLSRPILSFKIAKPAQHYAIENLGKGSASNVIIKSHFDNGKWQKARIYYGIRRGPQKY